MCYTLAQEVRNLFECSTVFHVTGLFVFFYLIRAMNSLLIRSNLLLTCWLEQ